MRYAKLQTVVLFQTLMSLHIIVYKEDNKWTDFERRVKTEHGE